MDKKIDVTSLCACIGPVKGQPFCPCQMQKLGLSDGKEYAWTEDDKDRLAKVMEIIKRLYDV